MLRLSVNYSFTYKAVYIRQVGNSKKSKTLTTIENIASLDVEIVIPNLVQ
jgi:hypothetical protein